MLIWGVEQGAKSNTSDQDARLLSECDYNLRSGRGTEERDAVMNQGKSGI